ncbi:MAG TPA: VOC family protein [Solirubrobacteraceae bacterium]|jgi:glyoxalase family protein|nr:VOC family protein [Solirubrobacteraceae bacterium]
MATGEPGRLRLRGLHHVTAISRDLERTARLYRDVLGLEVVLRESNPDDPEARHFWFGDPDPTGSGGTLISFLEYPDLPDGVAGPGVVHHFALRVGSVAELNAWVDWLRSREVECTEVLDRGRLRSLYLRDPDGHLVELVAEAAS